MDLPFDELRLQFRVAEADAEAQVAVIEAAAEVVKDGETMRKEICFVVALSVLREMDPDEILAGAKS